MQRPSKQQVVSNDQETFYDNNCYYAFRQVGVPIRLSLLAKMAMFEAYKGSEIDWDAVYQQLMRFMGNVKNFQELLVAEGLLAPDEIEDGSEQPGPRHARPLSTEWIKNLKNRLIWN